MLSRFALFLFVAGFATTAMSAESLQPSGRVSIQSRSIAAGIGVTWGDGKLTFKGKDYPFSIDGLSLVDWGISRASATGDVYNLTDVAKFAGTYVAAEAGRHGAAQSGRRGHAHTLDIARRQAAIGHQRTDH